MDIQQIFQNKVFYKYGIEYSVVGKYVNKLSRIEIQHNICGHKWHAVPVKFLSKANPRTCPKCLLRHNNEKANEEFIQEIKDLTAGAYTSLDPYINRVTQIRMRHNSCKHVWKVTPVSFITKGSRCPKCRKEGFKEKLSEEEFKSLVKKNFGNEISIIGTYIDMKRKIRAKHHVCGCEWEASPYSLIKKMDAPCPKCMKILKKTDKEFRNEVYTQVGIEYRVIGNYVNNKTKIRMKHNICGHEWDVRPTYFVGSSQSRCPKCQGGKRTHDEFLAKVFEAVGVEYRVLSQFTSVNKKVHMRHNNCGHEWEVRPDNFIREKTPSRCPKCNESKGEKRISHFLTDLGLDFVEQYRIAECKNIKPLPFDFAILNNKVVQMLIEFDGKQHFVPIKYRGGEAEFIKTQKRDAIKTKFCKKKNIPLVRIPYHQINEVESILKEALFKQGLLNEIPLRNAA